MSEISQLSLAPGVTISSRSLQLPDEYSREQILMALRHVDTLVDSGPFILGDIFNAMTKRHGITIAAFLKSDDSKTTPAIASFSYDSLNSFASVMAKLPTKYRLSGVSFAHHQTASRLIKKGDKDELEEAYGWLKAAKDKNLSLREMALAISGRSRIGDSANKPESSGISESIQTSSTLSDIAIKVHRQLASINDMLTDDPITEWSVQRRATAQLALQPIMDDFEKLTDLYVGICK